jgi:hypothetical protein
MRLQVRNRKATKSARRLALLVAIVLGMLSLFAGAAIAAGETWTTGKADYSPGEVVDFSGASYVPGVTYAVPVLRPDGSIVTVDPETHLATPGWHTATADADGILLYDYQLNGVEGLYEGRVYPADWLGYWSETPIASVLFTDGPPAVQNLWQCQPGPFDIGTFECATVGPNGWKTGNNDGPFLEGDTVPYRTRFLNLVVGNEYRIQIEWDTSKAGKHALDYLKTYNATVLSADPCKSLLGVSCPNLADTAPIPNDTIMDSDPEWGGVQDPGDFSLFNGTITSVSTYTLVKSDSTTVTEPPGADCTSGGCYDGDTSTFIDVTFKADSINDVVLAWGGHIASRLDWGIENSAAFISGSPFHMRFNEWYDVTEDVGLNLGNTDRSLSSQAVVFPALITVIKDAVPDDDQSFGFTLDSPLSADENFSLVDDGTDTNNSVTFVFDDPADFGTHVLTESLTTPGWDLTAIACTSNLGGVITPITTVDVLTGEATLDLVEAELITCTYTNEAVAPTLTLVKTVTNNNGGIAVPNHWDLTAAGDSAGFTETTPDVADATAREVTAGQVYTLSESMVPGYTAGDWSCDGGIQVGSTIELGYAQDVTCTINNDDQQAYVTVVKVVNNDHGGTAAPNDFLLTLDDGPVTSGVAVPVDPGTYTADETLLSGYTFNGFSGDCDVNGDTTVAIGEYKTCTLTNTDQQAYVTVVKVVNNDHGGTAAPNDFLLTLDDGSVTSGVAVPVDPGTYTADETLLSGYTFVSFTGDCGPVTGDVTVALGESKTCTLTNDDIQSYITVVKEVINNNGGSAFPNDFLLTLADGPVTSGVAVPVDPGTYTADETLLSGYEFLGFSDDCDEFGDTTVALGESKTCTLTNDDIQSYVRVVKVVNNDHGGEALPNDFDLTLDGAATLSGVLIPVDPGQHLAAETLLSGYTFDGYSGDCDVSGEIRIKLGETKTCTLTNTDQQSYITVVKEVINNNGGSAFPNDFLLTLADGPVTSGVAVPVDPGTYTADETLLSGYEFLGFSDDCDLNGDTTVALGESKTCTLTNDDIAPTLRLVKTVDNGLNETVTDAPNDWDLTAAGTDGFIELTPDAADATFNQVLANEGYDLSEDGPVGYIAGDWSCDTEGVLSGSTATLALNTDVTCTINNSAMGQVTVLKTSNGQIRDDLDIPFNLSGPGLPDGGIDDTTLGKTDGIVDFGEPYLIPGGTYTICEMIIAAGHTFEVRLDGTLLLAEELYWTDPLAMQVKCFDFTVEIGEKLEFTIENTFPGGEPRTPGYWKNWASCTGGGQAATAFENGGVEEGWYLIDDLLPLSVGDLLVDTCDKGIWVLSSKTWDNKHKVVSSDGAYNLARSLLATKLNIGAHACVPLDTDTWLVDLTPLGGSEMPLNFVQVIEYSDILLADVEFNGIGKFLAPKNKQLTDVRNLSLELSGILDDYNNGTFCDGTPRD